MQFLEENAPKPLLPKLTENAATCSESSGESIFEA